MDTRTVIIGKHAKKDLQKLPEPIGRKFRYWLFEIETLGLIETRKCKGYHDEPLQGNRKDQRSIRLNKAYRAIYTEHDNGKIELNYIEIDEVNKHE